MAKLSFVTGLVCAALYGAAANAAPIFSNDFSTDAHGFTTTGAFITTAPSNEKFLEINNNGGSTTLTLDTTGYVGGSVTLNFRLDVVGSMDGTGPIVQGGGSGDFFNVSYGAASLFNQAFANYDGGNKQTFPVSGSAPGTGATGIDKLGYSGFPDSGNGIQDSYYDFTLTFTPLSASTLLTFTSFANEDQRTNEFYGIDNVVASATAATNPGSNVPEPATWAMMLLGFGGVGTALRGRRRTVAPAHG